MTKEQQMDSVKEADIKYGFVGKLQDLKYTYRKDIGGLEGFAVSK